MSAAQILAQHRKLWRDSIAACSGCDWSTFGNLTRTDLAHAAHQIDALKAAGYAVVELPKPDCEATTFDATARGLGIWEFGEGARVAAWSDGYMVDENGSALGDLQVVRAWAAALLAACAAVDDAANASEATQ